MKKIRQAEGFWKGPIWLNLLRMLTERNPERMRLLQARGNLVKYLDERASLGEDRIYRLMQQGISQDLAEELAYGQSLGIRGNYYNSPAAEGSESRNASGDRVTPSDDFPL